MEMFEPVFLKEMRDTSPSANFVLALHEADLLSVAALFRVRFVMGMKNKTVQFADWRWPVDGESDERAAFLLALLFCRTESGSTRLPMDEKRLLDVIKDLHEQIKNAGSEQETRVPAPAKLVELARKTKKEDFGALMSGDDSPFVIDGTWLYARRYFEAECEIAEMLTKFFAELDPMPEEKSFRELAESIMAGKKNAKEQIDAIVNCAMRKGALVVGGPGRGKTTVVAALLRLLMLQVESLQPEDIAIVAPTGRAAARLHESLQRELKDVASVAGENEGRLNGLAALSGQTIHKLLQYNPFLNRFAYNEKNRLGCKVLVVDESSMVDLFLFQKLLRALPDDCRLYLLGDEHQLPSVDAGAVLGSISGDGVPYKFELTVNHRSAKRIGEFAESVNRCDGTEQQMLEKELEGLPDLNAENPEQLFSQNGAEPPIAFVAPFCGDIEENEERGKLKLFVRGWFDRFYGAAYSSLADADEWLRDLQAWREGHLDFKNRIFDGPLYDRCARIHGMIDNARILSLLRVGLRGAESLNRMFEEEFSRRNGDQSKHGFPVMIRKNDPSLELSNGDVGVLLLNGTGGYALLSKRGDGSFELIDENALPAYVSAFALTVHKSQGSEYENVALVLPRGKHRLLSREIVYTAITRAKKQVLILGRKDLFLEAACHPIRRDSGIAEKLAAKLSGN